MDEKRNVLIESARIARGNIKKLSEISADDIDGLVMPGGFGAAKNLTKWAFEGPKGEILPDVKRLINEMVTAGKPVAALCMSPAVVAKALEGTDVHAKLTVGTTATDSPNDIAGVSSGLEAAGAQPVMAEVTEIVVDEEHKIITSPCYMMEASITSVNQGIEKAIDKLIELAKANVKVAATQVEG